MKENQWWRLIMDYCMIFIVNGWRWLLSWDISFMNWSWTLCQTLIFTVTTFRLWLLAELQTLTIKTRSHHLFSNESSAWPESWNPLMASDLKDTAVKPEVWYALEKTIILEFKKNEETNMTVLVLDLSLTVVTLKKVDS